MTDNTEIKVVNAVQNEKIMVLTDRVNKMESTLGRLFFLLLANLFGLVILLLKELL